MARHRLDVRIGLFGGSAVAPVNHLHVPPFTCVYTLVYFSCREDSSHHGAGTGFDLSGLTCTCYVVCDNIQWPEQHSTLDEAIDGAVRLHTVVVVYRIIGSEDKINRSGVPYIYQTAHACTTSRRRDMLKSVFFQLDEDHVRLTVKYKNLTVLKHTNKNTLGRTHNPFSAKPARSWTSESWPILNRHELP